MYRQRLGAIVRSWVPQVEWGVQVTDSVGTWRWQLPGIDVDLHTGKQQLGRSQRLVTTVSH